MMMSRILGNPGRLPPVLLGLFIATGLADEPRRISAEQAEFFERRVRPLLVDNCFACHGEKKQEAGLRLDTRAAALKGGDGGAVIFPGKPDESELIRAVRYDGPLRMPPKKKLSADDVAALTEWVRLGAPWPEAGDAQRQAAVSQTHWAFQPLAKTAPPQVRERGWLRSELDGFVLAKLEEHGLSPAPPADRATLIRRATFDLIGLPPMPEEVAEFESDPAPTDAAFSRIVDRLLDSPHYGERWARHWLDVARYADNKGYVFFEGQNYPWAYTYRDWVIRALNEDLPYDQFIVQQLAADQLASEASTSAAGWPGSQRSAAPGERQSDRRIDVAAPGDAQARGSLRSTPATQSLAALGFLTVGGHFMNNVHDILDDRIDVVTRGLLGLTVTCARCHDHKYDPIGQADYYSLYGVFRSSSEPIVPPRLTDIPPTELAEHYEQGLAERILRLEKFLAKKHAELVSGARTRVAEYLLAAHASRDQPSTEDFMLLIPEGDLHPTVVQRYWLYLQKTRRQHDPVWAVWHSLAAIPAAEFAEKAAAVCVQLSASDPAKPLNPLVVDAVCTNPPASMKELADRYGELLNRIDVQRTDLTKRSAGAAGGLTDGASPRPAEEQLRQVFHAPDAPANLPMVAGWGVLTLLPDRPAQAEYQKLLKDLEEWMIHGPLAPPRAMTLQDEPAPYEPRIFLRGNPNRPGESVPRRFLTVLADSPASFSRGSGRLELARAIADPRNPLTARVLVNRVWMHHFGTGLVKTPADFGVRSDPPSHPELLDWLAATFIDDGWSIKRLHRRILLSATYQQSSSSPLRQRGARDPSAPPPPESATPGSHVAKGGEEVDPENRLLWRFPRRRLDFEALRDSLLAVAGTLDRSTGGPPANLLAGSNRRTLYGFIDRLALPGLLRTFDFPSPDSMSPRRDDTTVAPQALYLMNGVFAQDCAAKLAARPDIAGEPNLARRVDRLYRVLFARPPSDAELRLATEFMGITRGSSGDLAELPAPDEAALWARYAHALLLTNEVAFID